MAGVKAMMGFLRNGFLINTKLFLGSLFNGPAAQAKGVDMKANALAKLHL